MISSDLINLKVVSVQYSTSKSSTTNLSNVSTMNKTAASFYLWLVVSVVKYLLMSCWFFVTLSRSTEKYDYNTNNSDLLEYTCILWNLHWVPLVDLLMSWRIICMLNTCRIMIFQFQSEIGVWANDFFV